MSPRRTFRDRLDRAVTTMAVASVLGVGQQTRPADSIGGKGSGASAQAEPTPSRDDRAAPLAGVPGVGVASRRSGGYRSTPSADPPGAVVCLRLRASGSPPGLRETAAPRGNPSHTSFPAEPRRPLAGPSTGSSSAPTRCGRRPPVTEGGSDAPQ